jgi:transposase
MAYEEEYRTRVVEYVREGHTQREAADVFNVGTTSIKRWLASYNTNGTTGGGYTVANRSFKKVDPEKLEAYMAKHPDAFLKEVAKKFSCCIEASRKALARGRYTFKKNESLQGARRGGSKGLHGKDGNDPRRQGRVR